MDTHSSKLDPIQEIGTNIGMGALSRVGALSRDYDIYSMYTAASGCVFCFMADALVTPICYFSNKMPQVRTMHDKPGCVQT